MLLKLRLCPRCGARSRIQEDMIEITFRGANVSQKATFGLLVGLSLFETEVIGRKPAIRNFFIFLLSCFIFSFKCTVSLENAIWWLKWEILYLKKMQKRKITPKVCFLGSYRRKKDSRKWAALRIVKLLFLHLKKFQLYWQWKYRLLAGYIEFPVFRLIQSISPCFWAVNLKKNKNSGLLNTNSGVVELIMLCISILLTMLNQYFLCQL